MKKIYFACSISGGRDHAHVYEDIVKIIKGQGLHVISEIFAAKHIKASHGPTPELTAKETWERDQEWLKEADIVIAEVTQPSFGVGYEIAKAHEWDKPVLALFDKTSGRRLSPMIVGSSNVTVFEYNDISETEAAIAKFIAKL